MSREKSRCNLKKGKHFFCVRQIAFSLWSALSFGGFRRGLAARPFPFWKNAACYTHLCHSLFPARKGDFILGCFRCFGAFFRLNLWESGADRFRFVFIHIVLVCMDWKRDVYRRVFQVRRRRFCNFYLGKTAGDGVFCAFRGVLYSKHFFSFL